MYGNVPVIEKNVSGVAIAVWYALCTFCHWKRKNGQPWISVQGSCFPTIEKLVKRSHFGRTAVKAALRELEDAGYVRTEAVYIKRTKGGKGEQGANRYTLYANGGAPRREKDRAEFRERLAEFSRAIRNGDPDDPA